MFFLTLLFPAIISVFALLKTTTDSLRVKVFFSIPLFSKTFLLSNEIVLSTESRGDLFGGVIDNDKLRSLESQRCTCPICV